MKLAVLIALAAVSSTGVGTSALAGGSIKAPPGKQAKIHAPIQLSESQMDKIVAGGVVGTLGNGNLQLIAPGNDINSCNSGQCYWYNTNSGSQIGKPVTGF